MPDKAEPPQDVVAENPGDEVATELCLELVDDGLTARIPAVYPTTTTAEILDLLKAHGIASKYHTPQIRTAVSVAQETEHVVRDVLAAEGRPPKPAAPRVEYHLPKGLEGMPDLDAVRRLLDLDDRDEVLRAAPEQRGWLVKAGQALATLCYPDWAEGIDVRGEPIPPQSGSSAPGGARNRPGSGVKTSADGRTWVAEVYGYAGQLDGQVCVLSPVWVAADEMEACFLRVHLIAGSVIPSARHLRELLESLCINTGIDPESLDAFAPAQKQRDAAPLFVLARGKAEVQPRNPRPTFVMGEAAGAGASRQDGSVDYKERGQFPSVQLNDLLAECETAAPGEPGETVRGAEIPVASPVAVELVAGDNTRAETEDGVQRIFAAAEGGVTVEMAEERDEGGNRIIRHTIAVRSELEIPSDVDYETGHVDFSGNVVVAGSVKSGFRVTASGNLVIKGSLEAGAEVSAGGSLTVEQGIIGRETVVKVEGGLTVKYVQDARVEVAGDITVDSYLHGAFVVAGGQVLVEGAGGGGIIGGEVWALRGIRSLNVGSEGSGGTMLYAGLEPSQLPRLQQIRQAMRTAEDMLARLLASSGLESFDEAEVDKVAGHSESRQEAVRQTIEEARQHTENRDDRAREEKELTEQIAEAAKLATIEVSEQAHVRTRLQIGSHDLTLAAEEAHVRFRVADDGIVSSDLG